MALDFLAIQESGICVLNFRLGGLILYMIGYLCGVCTVGRGLRTSRRSLSSAASQERRRHDKARNRYWSLDTQGIDRWTQGIDRCRMCFTHVWLSHRHTSIGFRTSSSLTRWVSMHHRNDGQDQVRKRYWSLGTQDSRSQGIVRHVRRRSLSVCTERIAFAFSA